MPASPPEGRVSEKRNEKRGGRRGLRPACLPVFWIFSSPAAGGLFFGGQWQAGGFAARLPSHFFRTRSRLIPAAFAFA